MSRRRDPLTKCLFEWEAEQVAVGYSDDVAGRGSLDNQIARLVSRALGDAKDAGIARAVVAARMSDFLDRPIAENMLHKWASQAAEGHRIPLDAFIALVKATGQLNLLGFIPGLFGFAVMPDRYVDIIELQQIEEHEAEVQARKAILIAKTRRRR